MGKQADTSCVKPGCNKPRMVAKCGRKMTMCEDHQRAYWRSAQQARAKQRRSERGEVSTPSSLAAILSLRGTHVRILRLRCTVCRMKLPYTDEYFDVAAEARTCRRCASGLQDKVLTVVNPLTHTALRLQVVAVEQVTFDESDEAYAAFARAEQAAGRRVAVVW